MRCLYSYLKGNEQLTMEVREGNSCSETRRLAVPQNCAIDDADDAPHPRVSARESSPFAARGHPCCAPWQATMSASRRFTSHATKASISPVTAASATRFVCDAPPTSALPCNGNMKSTTSYIVASHTHTHTHTDTVVTQ